MSVDEKPLGKIEHPKDLDSQSKKRLHWFEFIISLLKLIFGIIIMSAGIYLIIKRIQGATTLKMELADWKLDINTSVIGIVCIILGLVLCYFAKLNVKVNN